MEFSKQYSVRHEIRKRILHRFREEGITIPFPTRSIRMDDARSTFRLPRLHRRPKTL